MKAIFAEQSNLQLSTVDTPNQGLELALQQLPNLIVCDISLPEMDGFQVLKELQQHQQTRDIPVIALSANAAPELIEKSLRAGFQRYHTKPINLKEFKQSLDELLNDG